MENAKGAAADIGDRATETAEQGGARAERGIRGAQEAARRGADRAGRSLEAAGSRVRGEGRRARTAASDLAQLGLGHPLATTALGLAAGAGLALLIPRSRIEEEVIGDRRDAMVRDARRRTAQLVSEGVDAARESTARSVEAAADHAAKEVADKVVDGTDAVADAIKDKVGAPEDDDRPDQRRK
jgi:hypothetical protein